VRILFLVRILRLLRILRLFKMAAQTKELKVYQTAFRKQGLQLIGALVIISISCLFIATPFYFAEQSAASFDRTLNLWILPTGQVSFFQSLGDTTYWSFVCMATIGFGDLYPRTVLGRAIGVCAIFIGVFIFSFPAVILSITFGQEIAIFSEKHKNKAKLELLKLTSKGEGKFLHSKEILKQGWHHLVEIHRKTEELRLQIKQLEFEFSKYESLMIPFLSQIERHDKISILSPIPDSAPRSLYDYLRKYHTDI